MKKLTISLIFSAGLFAQTPTPVAPVVPTSVTGTIVIVTNGESKTYNIALPVAALPALAQFIADTTDTTTNPPIPKYADIGDLINQHLVVSLIVPIVARYPTAAIQAAATQAATAQAALANATAAASTGTVTVK